MKREEEAKAAMKTARAAYGDETEAEEASRMASQLEGRAGLVVMALQKTGVLRKRWLESRVVRANITQCCGGYNAAGQLEDQEELRARLAKHAFVTCADLHTVAHHDCWPTPVRNDSLGSSSDQYSPPSPSLSKLLERQPAAAGSTHGSTCVLFGPLRRVLVDLVMRTTTNRARACCSSSVGWGTGTSFAAECTHARCVPRRRGRRDLSPFNSV